MSLTELRFLVDVGVGKSVETYLINAGFDTKAVRDINPKMKDREIIQYAVQEKRIIITLDKDFGELVYHLSMQHSGILLLRLDDATGPDKLKVIKHLLTHYSNQIANSFCVYQNEKLRIRKFKSRK